MNQGLAQNHTIWGLHSVGNAGKVDQLGFLVPMNENDNPVRLSYAKINGKRYFGFMIIGDLTAGIVSPDKINGIAKTNCWI